MAPGPNSPSHGVNIAILEDVFHRTVGAELAESERLRRATGREARIGLKSPVGG